MNIHVAWFSLVVPALTFVWYLARRTDPHREKALSQSLEASMEKNALALKSHAEKSAEGFARVEKQLDVFGNKLESIGTKVIEHGVIISQLKG